MDRLAVRQQMAIDSHQHQKIEKFKYDLKKNAMRELEDWKVINERKEKKGRYM